MRKVKRRNTFFFDTSLIFPSLSSFNIIEKRKKEQILPFLREKVYICNRIADIKRYIDMKKEKNFSETDFSEKNFSEKIEPFDGEAIEDGGLRIKHII